MLNNCLRVFQTSSHPKQIARSTNRETLSGTSGYVAMLKRAFRNMVRRYQLCIREHGNDASEAVFRTDETFLCLSSHGYYPDPDDCRSIHLCFESIAYYLTCPSPLFFDASKNRCVEKTESLQCGPLEVAQDHTIPETEAPSCLPEACNLPDCFCSENGTEIPGNLLPNDTPQIIILTFTGAVNALNAEPLEYLLNETLVNPNGCPIKATFFVPHKYTDHYYVQKLYGQGHEIALQSITNVASERYWPTANISLWVEEVIGVKEIFHNLANIPREDLVGMRAPLLKSGGNNMMSMMKDYGLAYDSSLAVPLSNVPVWPYTMDYHMPHKCVTQNCPSMSFPGIWEFPLNAMKTSFRTGKSCVFLDNCHFPSDAGVIFEFLTSNFLRHYNTNRAPFLLNLPADWVMSDSKMIALKVFIEHTIENYPDAWFLTMQQALQWMRNPVPSNLVQTFDAWKCSRTRPICRTPRVCIVTPLNGRQDMHVMELCGKCPERFPWLNNIKGARYHNKVVDIVQKTT